jgi:hypothetical protein
MDYQKGYCLPLTQVWSVGEQKLTFLRHQTMNRRMVDFLFGLQAQINLGLNFQTILSQVLLESVKKGFSFVAMRLVFIGWLRISWIRLFIQMAICLNSDFKSL